MEAWKQRAEELYKQYGRDWSRMADELMPMFTELNHFEVKEKIRCYMRRTVDKQDNNTKVTGVFSDIHIPFNHPNYLQFCMDTFKKYSVKQVVCAGDLVDHHAISRFQSEPCAKGAYDELDMSIAEVAKYTKAFPVVKMCRGNHDAIPARQAASVGIGERYLKSFSELLELPEAWEIADEFIINDVLYKHGINCMGKDGAINAAIQERMSTVIGHSHAFAGCKYSANKRNIIFGMNVGCGIDIDAYAFAYGKYDKNRPILGCGIVFSSSNAIFVPMGKEYFRGGGI